MAYVNHNHASMLGTYLSCPACNTPRFAKKGQDGRTGQEVWYLGCECPAPSGIVAGFHRKPKMDEVVDYLRLVVTGRGR